MIVAEDRLLVGRKQKRQRPPTLGQIGQLDDVQRRVDLGAVEVVDPELVKVAEHDILGPIGREPNPVIKRLPKMPAEILATLLHLDQDDRLPNVVGKRDSTAVFFRLADAILRLAADIQ